ncbi:MAG: rhodanese-like domain-containing protein [Gammaproteobacteria bacterium]|nr:rhodanese-like domain-containing protein [Gammaproteobacteria bacterium]MCW8988834.1 rhodanese-like domain-containing protein [Gammaproteobacteria bacterium]MCW9031713.1 rhodanese-like domain-containing protein [Gammaproteobacteria bacterium]
MKINLIARTLGSVISLSLLAFSHTAFALDVNITEKIPYIAVQHKGKTVRIQRIQDQNHHLTGSFTKTSRKCPPFCIQPMNVAPGVETFGELEVINFIENYVKTNKGLLIDARTPSFYEKGTIPLSINIPFTVFSLGRNDKDLIDAMKKIGVERRKEKLEGYWTDLKDVTGIEKKPNPYWDFSNAKNLTLWCNGMWCGQSPRAIEGLIKMGYPVEKIHYYRAGMQGWLVLGLSITVP